MVDSPFKPYCRSVECPRKLWGDLSPDIDDRFHPKERVLGLLSPGRAKAYPYSTMQQDPVVNDNFDGEDVVIDYWQEGAMAVPFRRTVDGRSLTFVPM